MTGPRAILPPRPDGGTTFCVSLDPDAWTGAGSPTSPELRAWRTVVEQLRAPRSREDEARESDCPQIYALPIAGTFHGASAAVYGTRRERIALNFKGQARLSVNLESGATRVELRAEMLWRGDWRREVTDWLCGIHLMLTGRHMTMGTSHDVGWSCTRLDLCADFENLAISAADRESMLTRSKIMLIDRTRLEGEDIRDRHEPIETMEAGSRSGAVQFVIYDKTKQVNIARRGVNAPYYAAAWTAAGWDGVIDRRGKLDGPPIRRVEVRFRNRGLELIETAEEKGTHAEKFNLRDPAAILSDEILFSAWRWATSRCMRLVELTDEKFGRITRRCRAPTDPRWTVVQDAALAPGLTPTVALKQSQRQSEDIQAERQRRIVRKVVVGLAELEAVLGMKISGPLGRAILLETARGFGAELYDIDPDEHHTAYSGRTNTHLSGPVADSREVWVDAMRRRGLPLDEVEQAHTVVTDDGRPAVITIPLSPSKPPRVPE